MSKGPAAIPLFGDAYLADTTHLSCEEHGAYLLLMMAAWRQDDCALPCDDKKLARITGLSMKKWASIKPTIMEFWTEENGRIFQGRLRKEHEWVAQKSAHNRSAAEARWNKQPPENKQPDPYDRISEGNAPPPPPPPITELPSGSSADEAENPAPEDPPSPDPTKVVIDAVVPVLVEAGYVDKRARSMTLKWLNDYGEGDVQAALAAFLEARPRPVEPISFMSQVLANTRTPTPKKGSRYVSPSGPVIDQPVNGFARAALAREAERARVRVGQPDP